MPERAHSRLAGDDEVRRTSTGTAYSIEPKSSKKRKRKHRDSNIATHLAAESNDTRTAEEDLPNADSSVSGSNARSTGDLSSASRRQARPAAPTKPTARPDHGALAARRQALLQTRKSLPIWAHQQAIRSALREKDVLVLSGETGSGKSTQIPQFLQHEQWCSGRIAVTQPRRVAAISLARRVAEEMGTPLGSASPASKVGYSVRFDNSTSTSTRIKFLTEGMLLQEMLRSPKLAEYSAVIVDEVHERSVNVDLILGFLKGLLLTRKSSGKPLKVIIMSATAEVEKIARFFDADPEATAAGGSNDHGPSAVESDSDSESSWSGLSSSDHKEDNKRQDTAARAQPKAKSSSGVEEDLKLLSNGSPSASTHETNGTENTDGIGHVPRQVSIKAIEGRQYPVQVSYLPEASNEMLDACIKAILQIHTKEPLPGDVLVFLPGQEAIESLERQINELSAVMGRELPKILTLPLFAALPQAAQQRIFEAAPPRTRKVILSTNIAETSVTVPGIRHVIDSGKAKKKMFHSRIGIEALLPKPISQSEAIQRKGRAGREAPGKCYRLYTEEDYSTLETSITPEILRCDLSSALLVMKARGVRDILAFPLLDRPPLQAMTKALELLLRLGALQDDGSITEVGRKIARLPLTPAHGRVLVEAATPDKDCVTELIDIIAGLSVENVFLNPATEEKREMAEEARRELFRREGDHITLLSTVRGYAAEQTDRKGWADKHWVSHRAMQNVMSIRKQLHSQCREFGFLPKSSQLDTDNSTPITEERAQLVIQCLLSGFLSNTATLMPDGSYRTIHGRHLVAIHPSSVLFGRKLEAIMFSEFLFTKKAYARGVSAVQLPWISDLL